MSTPKLATLEPATFTTKPAGGGAAETFTLPFNPESLSYSHSNSLKKEGEGGAKAQYVDQGERTLSMSLVFDTTHSGADVRADTARFAAMLRPTESGTKQVPPSVEFSWGSIGFEGVLTQFTEKLDFFSAEGVPLRASVELSLTGLALKFDAAKDQSGGAGIGAQIDTPVISASAGIGVGGAAGLSAQLGDPRGARSIASANGASSLRFGGETGFAISTGIELKSEAAFSVGAGAGLSLGVGGGAGAGIGGGAGLSVGGGASLGVGAGAAAGGAFGGLRSSASVSGAGASFSAGFGGAGASFGVSASFGIGGQAGASAGLSADVGGCADLNALIRFG